MNPYIQSLGINRFWGEMGEDKNMNDFNCPLCHKPQSTKGICQPCADANYTSNMNPTPHTQTPPRSAALVAALKNHDTRKDYFTLCCELENELLQAQREREKLKEECRGWKELHDTNEACINNQLAELTQLRNAVDELVKAAEIFDGHAKIDDALTLANNLPHRKDKYAK